MSVGLGLDVRITLVSAGLIFLLALLLGEVGGFGVLLAGFVASQF